MSLTKIESGAIAPGAIAESDLAINVYTTTEIDTALGLKANQSTTYTKTEVDTSLSSKLSLNGGALTGSLDIAAQKYIQIGSTRHYRYTTDVNLTTPSILLNSNGVALQSTDTNNVYRIKIVTTGTGTNTGNVFLARNVDSLGWEVRRVSGDIPGSNIPEMIVINGVPQIRTQHPSLYTLEVSVEEFRGQNNGTSWSVFGVDSGITVDYNGRMTLPYQPAFDAISTYGANTGPSGYQSFGNIRLNRGNCFDGSTFTAPVTGMYQFNVQWLSRSGAYIRIDVYINGVQVYTNENTLPGTNYQEIGFSQAVYMVQGDSIRFSSGGYNTYGSAYNYASGYLIG